LYQDFVRKKTPDTTDTTSTSAVFYDLSGRLGTVVTFRIFKKKSQPSRFPSRLVRKNSGLGLEQLGLGGDCDPTKGLESLELLQLSESAPDSCTKCQVENGLSKENLRVTSTCTASTKVLSVSSRVLS